MLGLNFPITPILPEIRGRPMVGHFVDMVFVRLPAQLPATPFRAGSGARFFRAAGDREAYHQHLWEG
jgi:hypothetical protein